MRGNVIIEKTFEFAVRIVAYAEVLEAERKYVVAKQLLRSGTSVGANTREAQSAESKADFIHKLKIADKEAKETRYWLDLCKASKNYINPEKELFDLLTEIEKLFSSIISSAKRH